ncbi:hypothetical protein ACQKWADRAFT_279142 [Trichoderma austrokoningii]
MAFALTRQTPLILEHILAALAIMNKGFMQSAGFVYLAENYCRASIHCSKGLNIDACGLCFGLCIGLLLSSCLSHNHS